SGVLATSESGPSSEIRRILDFPNRSLSGEAAGTQYGRLPLHQRFHGGVLEPQLYRERANHDGGGFRRPGPRQLLRSDRNDPRRRPESFVSGSMQSGDGSSGENG